jgi:hypothetical protein
MNRKTRLKKTAKNFFTKHTGVPATQLSGSKQCLVVDRKTVLVEVKKDSGFNEKVQLPLIVAAFYLSHGLAAGITYEKLPKAKEIIQACGIDQCVNQDHIITTMSLPPAMNKESFDAATDGWVT